MDQITQQLERSRDELASAQRAVSVALAGREALIAEALGRGMQSQVVAAACGLSRARLTQIKQAQAASRDTSDLVLLGRPTLADPAALSTCDSGIVAGSTEKRPAS